MKRLREINEYYDNLEYNENNKQKALAQISVLSKEVKCKDVNDVSERFFETASVIEKNLSLFESACGHVDIVTTIIEYLINFGVKFMLDCEFEEQYNRDEIIYSIILTIFNVCKEHEVQLFLEDTIIQHSILDKTEYQNLKSRLSNQTNEMILLQDSDLHTVINHLMIMESSCLNKIWVQEAIKQKFSSFIKRYLYHKKFPIYVFQSKQELQASSVLNNINIVSIWSEDIIAARNLAAYLNKEVLFINMHMDLYGGVVLLPYVKIFDNIYKELKHNFEDSKMKQIVNTINISSISKTESIFVYNLFYDGHWQKPVKGEYWKHDESLWANATSDDINRCFISAKKGFEMWSNKSTMFRKKVLVEFVSTLECNGKFPLAEIMSKWINFPYLGEHSILCTQNEKLEVTNNRKPRGIIILKEGNEIDLFHKLIQILTAGNCVIVISDAESYNLIPYCDMFTISGIPPGVINLLLSENVSNLELNLCATDYASYAKRLFSEINPENTYINLTVPKQIILPLK